MTTNNHQSSYSKTTSSISDNIAV